MGLCFDLGSVLEGDSDPRILGDGHIIDHRQPVLIPEDRQGLSLLQIRQKQLDLLASGLPVGDLLGQHLLAGLGGVEPVHQRVVAFLVICLIEGNMGVFFDAVLDQTSDYVDLRVQSIKLLLKVIGGQMGLQYFVVDGDDSVLGVDHLVGGPEEDILQLILCERRRGAFLSFKLVIALPDDPAILVVGMPDLRPVPTAAAAALHPAGEDADRASSVLSRLSGGHKDLDRLEGIRRDDGFVVVPDVVLRDFTLVVLFLLGQEVHGVGLLEQGIALVFLVRQDAADIAGVPVILPSR